MPSLAYRSARAVRAALAVGALFAAVGCAATSASGDAARADARPTPVSDQTASDAPAWKVGATWEPASDRMILAATRDVLATCVLEIADGFAGARLTEDGPRFAVVDPAGERLVWGVVETPIGAPAARTLNIDWRDGVDPRAQTAVVTGVNRRLTGADPC